MYITAAPTTKCILVFRYEWNPVLWIGAAHVRDSKVAGIDKATLILDGRQLFFSFEVYMGSVYDID